MGGRGRTAAALVLVALAGSAAPASGEDPVGNGGAPPSPPGAPGEALQREVDRAVERGIAYLRKQQDGDGGFGTTAGETGLALWALRHCGVPQDDPAAKRAAARLDREIPDGTTYSTSLGICGLLAHDLPTHRERIQKAVDALVRGQCENGQWTYLTKGGKKVGDNSNTQCAALALGAARLRGLKVPMDALKDIVKFASRTQNEDGGWGYSEHQQSGSYGSMTAGVLMSWALGSAAMAGVDPRKTSMLEEREAKRALAWLAKSFEVAGNPGNGGAPDEWTIYWLWSLERAGVLCGFERCGQHVWYPEGAKWLLSRQTEKGAWTEERTLPDTCWALLFLRRGSLAVVTPGRNEAGATTPDGGAADSK